LLGLDEHQVVIEEDNVHKISDKERHSRKIINVVLLTGLFIFWSVPVTFIAGYSNLGKHTLVPNEVFPQDNLSKVKWLRSAVGLVDRSSALKSFLVVKQAAKIADSSKNGFLPSLAMLIFMGILPLILEGSICAS